MLLGHSYGGFLALEFALRWPEKLNYLVLVCTSAGPVNLQLPMCDSDIELREIYRTYWPAFFASPDKHWEIFDRLSFSARPYRVAFEHELPRFDVRSQAPRIKVPTLLISGSEDRYRTDMEWLNRAVPNSRLALINGAGHMPFIEEPHDFTRAIGEFLKK